MVMMMEGVSNSTNQAAMKMPIRSLPSPNVYGNYGTDCGRAGFPRAPHGTCLTPILLLA